MKSILSFFSPIKEIRSQRRIKCKHDYCLGSCSLKAEPKKGLSGAALSEEEARGEHMRPGSTERALDSAGDWLLPGL